MCLTVAVQVQVLLSSVSNFRVVRFLDEGATWRASERTLNEKFVQGESFKRFKIFCINER